MNQRQDLTHSHAAISGMWYENSVTKARTIVLTTHYMEEAETLAHRVGIIDAGQLLALDTTG